jgi:chromosome segregation ATPase
MSDTKPEGRSHKLAIVLVLVSLVAAAFLLVNRQHVIDQVAVWQYQPNGQITALAERASMNDRGKFYFYASQPALEEAQEFNQKCDRKEQSTAILGCYAGRFIYIYNVTDEKLDGIREVTAAHEMLHAAYDRLTGDERTNIDKLLTAEYETLKNDEKLAERMAFYARTEPGERNNELHSVIGTEVANVNPALEEYYKRYFVDRSKIVSLHDKYESVFNNLQSRAENISAELAELGDSIEADSVDYNKQVNQLNQDIQTFNASADSGGFSSQAEFNAARNSLVERANQLDAMRDEISGKVAQYETLRKELLGIASQSEELNRSIDSTLAPAPSL